MNAIRSHSISRSLGLLVAGVLSCVPLFGQEGEARLYGQFTSGEFRTPSEASQLWTAGAEASATVDKNGLEFNGHFGFEFNYGNNMMGSMFTSPGYYPIDILEFTPGPKTKQTYAIDGGVAWHNRSQWTPSLQVAFKGINYAKRKDLRHTTYRQEANVEPAIRYDGSLFHFGLGYLFEKTSEFVQAEQIGSATADSYYAFLDKGMRFGTMQVWNGSGTHLAESGVDRLPVQEISHGANLMLGLGPVEAQGTYRYYNGIVGEKGYTWFRFPSHKIEVSLEWTHNTGAGEHVVRAEYYWKDLKTFESVLEKENYGGVIVPVIYGSNIIYGAREMEAGPSWQFTSVKGWSVECRLDVDHSATRSTLMYPFLYYEESTHLKLEASSSVPLGRFLVTARLGGSDLLGDRSHSVEKDETNLGITSVPTRLKDWWDMESEITDAPQIWGKVGLRYTFAGKLPFFLEASFEARKAFKVESLPGSFRQSTQLSFGYSF